jgi:hypothetical protein
VVRIRITLKGRIRIRTRVKRMVPDPDQDPHQGDADPQHWCCLCSALWRSRRILIGPFRPPPLRAFISCTISPPGSDWLLVQVVVSSAAGLDSFTASPSLVKMASSFMQSSTSGLGKRASYFTHSLSKFTNIDWVLCVPTFAKYSTAQYRTLVPAPY